MFFFPEQMSQLEESKQFENSDEDRKHKSLAQYCKGEIRANSTAEAIQIIAFLAHKQFDLCSSNCPGREAVLFIKAIVIKFNYSRKNSEARSLTQGAEPFLRSR
jgi:hypothetical protein